MRNPTDFRQWLPIESAKHLCLRVIFRWLISLAVPDLAGRCSSRMSLAPSRSPVCVLPLVWDKIDVTTSCHTLCCRLCAQSQQEVRSALWECSRAHQGHSCCMAKSPASCLVLPTCWNFGNLEWYYISPGSKETFRTSLINVSQSFNNAAIYRLDLYWIGCRSCTKAQCFSNEAAEKHHSRLKSLSMVTYNQT